MVDKPPCSCPTRRRSMSPGSISKQRTIGGLLIFAHVGGGQAPWETSGAGNCDGLSGGARRDRTVDLYNAIVALSQLSYGPRETPFFGRLRGRRGMVGTSSGPVNSIGVSVRWVSSVRQPAHSRVAWAESIGAAYSARSIVARSILSPGAGTVTGAVPSDASLRRNAAEASGSPCTRKAAGGTSKPEYQRSRSCWSP